MEAEAETGCGSVVDSVEHNDSLDSTIHGFNAANVTVVERSAGTATGDGSDSGVELAPGDAYEDVFARLARRNSLLLKDLKDGSGSESSSTSSRPVKRITSAKKKVAVINEPSVSSTASKSRSRPSSTVPSDRSKSKERPKPAARPSTLKTSSGGTPRPRIAPVVTRSASTSRAARTPVGGVTPTQDDGRWPSTATPRGHNHMTRSFRGSAGSDVASATSAAKPRDTKNTLDKYATLPRRRRERSADNVRETSVTRPDKPQNLATVRRQASRESTPARVLPPCCPKKKVGASVQTEPDPMQVEVRRLRDALAAEQRDKQALRDELDSHKQRVYTILGHTDYSDDNLLELESRFEVAGQVIIKQENEISELHAFCRTLQRELECREAEGQELQEFLSAEKATLSEALGEAEAELRCVVRAAEQRRQEALTLAARLAGLEARSRDLLLAHGAAVSAAGAALTGLAQRLDSLAADLSLDTDVYHNEAYSPDTSDISDASPASFLASVVSAIRTAVTVTDDNDMLDSETEPCLMMDAVLEDVVLPDTHSVNLVSGDSLHNLAQAILQRQRSEQNPAITYGSLPLPDTNAEALVDQVLEAEQLVTRVVRAVRGVHSALAQQLRDWEALGARLKAELASKVTEVEGLRADLTDARALLQQHWRDHYRQLDQALETLHECGGLVGANPALVRLQRDLEAASFACAAAPLQPPSSPDHNANANNTLINSMV